MYIGLKIINNLVILFSEELSVSGNPGDTEKTDMRIVQAAAQEVCCGDNNV